MPKALKPFHTPDAHSQAWLSFRLNHSLEKLWEFVSFANIEPVPVPGVIKLLILLILKARILLPSLAPTGVSAVCMLLVLLSGCRPEQDRDPGTVLIHLPTNPATLHPTNGNGAFRSFLFQYTQKKLQRTDIRNGDLIHPLLNGAPKPGPDSLTFTYQLKDGVKWDDGSRLTVKDVVFTLKVNSCPLTNNPSQQSIYDPINHVETLPKKPGTFQVVFDKRHFANYRIFANGLYLMQRSFQDPERIMADFTIPELQSQDFNSSDHPRLQSFMQRFNDGSRGRKPAQLNGLGPYKVTKWKSNNSLVLKRKQDWWGAESDLVYNQQGPEQLIFQVIRDQFAAGLALRNGTLDVSTHVSLNELIKARKRDYFRKKYRSKFVERYGFTYIALNMRPGPEREPYFKQLKVRRAIAHLTPVKELIKVVTKGKATRQNSFVSPLKASYNDTLSPTKENIPKARQLLTAAGWTDDDGDGIRDTLIKGRRIPLAFEFQYINDPNKRQMATLIKEVMEEAGVKLKPKAMEFSAFYEEARNHEFDAMLGHWSGYSGPVNPRQLWHTDNWLNNGSNFTGYGNAQTDSLIELANRTMNTQKRHRLIKTLQARVHQQQPYVFLFSKKRAIAIHSRFDKAGMYRERPGVILNNFKPVMEGTPTSGLSP